jgi:hypothetical protein
MCTSGESVNSEVNQHLLVVGFCENTDSENKDFTVKVPFILQQT